ncbi:MULTISPECIES: GntR family transcriptional regulator [unclassified Ochrobactrum]|uniref:GntR family transcriptional regulator n=1 Tax=unclassified Ochrobactrum TaxID=239106 RepID=UPI0030B0974F
MAGQRDALTHQIVEKIWLSIAERRLRPGFQLKEEELAAFFNVSRTRARQALAALSREGLVDIVPNHGAFICKPTVREARDVFFVRRAVERCVVQHLCKHATRADLRRLSHHLSEEKRAISRRMTTDIIKLSGGFHVLLAELTSSDFLFTMMRDLISRTSLITAIYRDTDIVNCGSEEHAKIVEAITKQNAEQALCLLAHHLDHVESKLDLREVNEYANDLSTVLR